MEWHIDTKCIQEGWKPRNGEPRVLPIVQSTTFKYDSAQTLGDLFDLKIGGDSYKGAHLLALCQSDLRRG